MDLERAKKRGVEIPIEMQLIKRMAEFFKDRPLITDALLEFAQEQSEEADTVVRILDANIAVNQSESIAIKDWLERNER